MFETKRIIHSFVSFYENTKLEGLDGQIVQDCPQAQKLPVYSFLVEFDPSSG